jgi:hypothetical protein
MADHFYGINIGGGIGASGVTFGTASAGTTFEFRINDGVAGMDKMKADAALIAIRDFIAKNNAPA